MKQPLVQVACILAVTANAIALTTAESFAETATAEKVVLNNSVGQLSVAPSGAMRFTTESADCPVWSVRSDRMWVITLAKGESPFKLSDAINFTPGSQNVPEFATIENGVELRYDSLRHGGKTWDIGLTLQVRQAGEEFEFLAKLDNCADGWCVQHFKFPILFEVRKDGADHQELAVLLPSFLGERLATPEKFGKHRRITYPSGRAAAMQYCVLDSGKAGLYLACHDQKRSRKSFAIANQGSSYDFSLENEPYCMTGESWSSAPAVVMPYAGTWHTAARRYRAWIDTWMKWAPAPEWVRSENAGWFLCILKQQNGDLMFRYDELDRVADSGIQLEIPKDCAVLVVPNQTCLTDSQLTALIAFAEGGGRLVVTGETGDYDERYRERRDNPLEILDGYPSVVRREEVDGVPVRESGWTIKVASPEKDGCKLISDITSIWQPRIRVDAPATVFTEVKQDEGGFTVHLLNYASGQVPEGSRIVLGSDAVRAVQCVFMTPMENPEKQKIPVSSDAQGQTMSLPQFADYAAVDLRCSPMKSE